jgi:uncharacterized protein (DUF58 family)
LKFLDWRVFARTDRISFANSKPTRTCRCYLVLDTSASMKFTSGELTRFDFRAARRRDPRASLVHQGDATGLCLFSEAKLLGPSARAHADRAASDSRHARHRQAAGRNEPRPDAPRARRSAFRQRSLVIIVSDLFTEVPELLDCFKHLRFYKHDVAVFHLLDRQEFDFDSRGPCASWIWKVART